jgi:hypothetical protein
MAACRNVLQEDDTLCELYVDRGFDVSYSENESMDSEIVSDSDGDVPTSSRKQLRCSVVSSDAETSTIEEVVNRRIVMKEVMCGVKLIKSKH